MSRFPHSGLPSLPFPRVAALAALACLLLFPATLPGAEPGGRKTVRIPCQEFNRQMIVDEEGHPVSGYAYDYIQTIATYAGWDVEYIPCGSFSEGLDKIANGEADLFYEVSKTEEREEKMLFPDEPMGFEYYYLYASASNTSLTPDDYASLDGKSVGVTTGVMMFDLLRQWAARRNLDFRVVAYDSIPDKEADLHAGKIDLDLEVGMLAKDDLSAVAKIGSSSYYLVANKNRPDLVGDIDSAMDKVLNNDLYYFSRLQERYFSDTVLSRNLTIDEKAWLAAHKVLRAGYFDRYLPFSATDGNGQAIGAAIDAVREIVRRLGLEGTLPIEFVRFDDQAAGYRAVESGEIDLMLPAYISSSVQRDYGIIGGRTFATLAGDFVFPEGRGFGDGENLRIAVNRNNLMQRYYSRDAHPHAEFVYFDGIHACLDGLLDGKADGTYLNGLRTGGLLATARYRTLGAMRARTGFEFRMAFADENLGLMLLMNRGLAMLEPDFVYKNSFSYVELIYTFSPVDFLREHVLASIAAVAFLAALLAVLAEARLRNRKLAKVNRSLKEYSETIETQRRKETALREELERKQADLEDALQMAQAANRAKTAFLNNVSHDIRTPMNAIIGFTGLAASHPEDTERVREYLGTIARSSEHLLSLINDVLDMSRIESGKASLNEKVESLAEILHALRDIVQAGIRSRQHAFSIDTVDIRNERVWCDKTRLNQVLLNLVGNAIKYTPPGGKISLRIAQKAVSHAGYATFEFRCRDNGIGMDEEFARTVFDPFTREENAAVSGVPGTGLGMAITKNIVEMMGGRISVSSKRGEGTEFTVLLDFRVAEGETPDPEIPELKGLRSLVVDDDVNACQGIADMLRDAGMRSEWCVSGKEAVIRTEEALRHGDRFKVYVVDWQMPDMNGIETARRIRKVAGEDASVIILTACDRGDAEAEAREAGVSAFAPKPLFPSDLHRVLLQSCGKAPAGRGKAEKRPFALAGRKVLMVDDSALNLKIGVLLLRERGMVVDTAENGREAVEKIREKGTGAYDFVVMDVQMPVMGGYEATAAIRKLPGGDKLKIIAFSANAFEEDKEKSLAAGMDGHITKPLKIEEFLKELQRFSA